MRSLLLASICLIAGLLTSCFDGKEEFWLNENGSGKMEVTYDIPTSALKLGGGEKAMREAMEGWLKDSPGIRQEVFEIVTSGDRTKVHGRIAFDAITKVVELSKGESTKEMPATFRYLVGEFDFKRSGRTVELSRTVSPNKAIGGVALFMPKKEIEGKRLVYVVHLPMVPVVSDATRTEDGGKTLVWDFTLADGLKHPLVTSLKAEVPIPVWLVASAAGVIVVLIALAWWVVKKVRGRSGKVVGGLDPDQEMEPQMDADGRG